MFATLMAKLAAMEAAVQSWFAGDQSKTAPAQAEVNTAVAAHLSALDARVSKLEGVEPATAPDPAAAPEPTPADPVTGSATAPAPAA